MAAGDCAVLGGSEAQEDQQAGEAAAGVFSIEQGTFRDSLCFLDSQ